MRKRITEAFAKAKSENRGAFVAYLTAGFPSPAASEDAAVALAEGGADVIELGVPFSDPFADGGVIRAASYEALKQGMTLKGAMAMAARLRERLPDTGIVLFSYYNPLFSMGLGEFASRAAGSGVDAVLAVDLPVEERTPLVDVLSPRGLGFIPLAAPNTPEDRVREIASGLDNSFLYAITVKGVTGARAALPADLAARLDALRLVSPLPVAAGFGISSRAQADEVSRHADGFVVGSALVKQLAEGKPPCLS